MVSHMRNQYGREDCAPAFVSTSTMALFFMKTANFTVVSLLVTSVHLCSSSDQPLNDVLVPTVCSIQQQCFSVAVTSPVTSLSVP